MTVSLRKGQTITLAEGLTGTARMGLSWDAAKKPGFFGSLLGRSAPDVDLDASCIILNHRKECRDTIWFRQLVSKDGSVSHSGDNLTGEGSGDDEVISVNLDLLPPEVMHLIFTVNSFTGQAFDAIENATCRLLDSNHDELVRYVLAEKGSHTGVIMAALSRPNGVWTMKAVGTPADGRTVHHLASAAAAAV